MRAVIGTLASLLTLSAQDLVRVPGGSYEVTDAITTVKLKISVSAFEMAATETTQREYEALTGANPSFYKGPDRPVENVSWWDAIRYANLRSVREKLTPCYDLATGHRDLACTGYRLPTEAEWIVAAGPMPKREELTQHAKLGSSSTKSLDVLKPSLEAGTAPVRSLQPGPLGLYGLRGNVWEWCEDWFHVLPSPDTIRNPRGPSSGLERVVRGGSFVSSTSSWSREFRSSRNPESRSRYTGFRVVRSIPHSEPSPEFSFRRYNEPPEGFATSIGSLTPLVPEGTTAKTWPETADRLRKKWESLLAEPKLPKSPPITRKIADINQRNFKGEILELQTEPGAWEKIYILHPSIATSEPRPVIIVPFYDIDTPAAADLGGRNYAPARGVNAFAYTAAQHGYIAVAMRWFGESYGESYSEAVANLALRHPGSTGLGKWVADARKLLDFIETIPGADPLRIGIMGHSLGGKMALYAAALDPRIKTAVSSELGIGFKHSNYEDYWYLGDKLATAPKGTDQHELIALLAPRPFLLIGGDEYDKAESWHYINAARTVYQLLGQPQHLGHFNHHTGHTPSPEAVALAFDWLDHFLKP